MNINIKEFSQSKLFKKILCGIGIAVVALLIFQGGVFVGYHKAGFSYRLGDNYHRTFGEERDRFPMGMHQGDFTDAHGSIGKIIKIDLPTFILEGQDGIEKIILVNADTTIRQFRETIKPTDLKINDLVVVIGSPNTQGQIESRLIRLMPSMPDFTISSSTKTK